MPLDSLSEGLEHNKWAYERFIQLWNNERYSPIILPRELNVLDTVKTYLRMRREDAQGYEKMHRDALHLHMERIQFLLDDYLRLRLSKLSDNPFLYTETSLQQYLTDNEITTARNLTELSTQLLDEAVFTPIRAMITKHASELDPAESFQKELRETFDRQLVIMRNKIVVARALEPVVITTFDADITMSPNEQLAVQFGAVEEYVIRGSVILVN